MVGFPTATSRLALAIGPPAQLEPPWTLTIAAFSTIWIVSVDKSPKGTPNHIVPVGGEDVIFVCPSARDAGKEFPRALEAFVDYVRTLDASRGILLRSGDKRHLEAALSQSAATDHRPPPAAKDLPLTSPSSEMRKTILPLALAIALAVPGLAGGTTGSGKEGQAVSKADIAQTLHHLVSLWPDGNPPRAALKRVNEYLMSGAYRHSA